ncbi:hydantoinase B/oxoprolinase family protein [Pelagicoccus albus]|uniref:Hydantoinase B/oxoprolinase family protein n=1 Tax=Pelagicoccus albus TaxID=415222 RepID=A0A7X1B6F5_9BACT|nr:hydantoinase B/oxoprolinase family protein [Pelagicoccus albus]MBC2606548.1 hydantoinase B/oxoprolinase family protein [Pelagicoccus albus]
MWKFCIDTGGTFTDCIATDPKGQTLRAKVLSSSCVRGRVVRKVSDRELEIEQSERVPQDFFRGYEFRVLSGKGRGFSAQILSWDAESGLVELDAELALEVSGDLCEIQSPEEPPILAARLLTGCRLDEALPDIDLRLATTRGTNALLERKGARTAFLTTRGFRDLLGIGDQRRPRLFELGIQKLDPLPELVYEATGRLDYKGNEIEALDEEGVRKFTRSALEKGVTAFSIAFMHSYRNPEHELRALEILKEEGVRFVSVSCQLSPFVKLLPRAETTVVDGYLSPIMESYLNSVANSLGEDGAGSDRDEVSRRFRIMTSAGGLVSRGSYHPKDSLLSGPAGGVVGASRSGLKVGYHKTIAFDMGGTSTDVSRYDGEFDYRFEQRIGAARVYAPSLRIETVAAGGGSVCWFDGSALRVGPHSAGASPGPACYGAGGPLAITDVNLLLGRLRAEAFGIPVFPNAAELKLEELGDEIEKATGKRMGKAAMLEGFLAIANETMAEAIRKISTAEGFDAADYALVAFGGAGGLHACDVASMLSMDTVIFPKDAGLLSAFGLGQASVEQFAEKQPLEALQNCQGQIEDWVRELEQNAIEKLLGDGVARREIEIVAPRYELRYRGQESILEISGGDTGSIESRFQTAYQNQFGFLPEAGVIELVAIRSVARSRIHDLESEHFAQQESSSGGATLEGPQVLQGPHSTVYIARDWNACTGSDGTLLMRKSKEADVRRERNEVVELELFTNRFLSIVGDMGALLERAAFSTNVKDRKDFSCAMLDAKGYLVANAPHIPVHLGALGVCVRKVLEAMALEDGDVVVTNHPAFGGSHLPDVTLIAPVYTETGDKLIGYVANRAHHAEIGGISPGSMPPNARSLAEEGVVISPFKLASSEGVDWPSMLRLLRDSHYPSRSVEENVADLSAQLASIRLGQKALRVLCEKEGVERVGHYMNLLKGRAETALRSALEGLGETETIEERLDNGAVVRARLSKQSSSKWLLDFTGTAAMQGDNYNATPAITTSAAIYVLRLLADVDLPLNEGFLEVVDIRIPEGMLNPRFESDPKQCPAVVAGNVEVSQLVVSCLIRALKLAACSQSTMNNLIFGTESFGYYETIAGGEGATDSRPGASGVHTHMTNTAMTDPEIMELRYPVRVEEFSIRSGSGGKGRQSGGDGVVKRIRFLEPVTLSLLTQRRNERPFGMEGGEPGACGIQLVVSPEGEQMELAGNGSWELEAGSILLMKTPGGGGWGERAQSI